MNTARIGELVSRVQSVADPATRAAALELVQAVMDLHAEALNRMMQIVSDGDSSGALRDALGDDDVVSSVLVLHDLHPLELEARVARALDQPAFQNGARRVKLISVDGGIVRIRAEGGAGLRAAIEKALANAAPDAVGLELEGESAVPADFVPIEQLLAT